MIIYPAVDILNGKCVRLLQGRYDKVTGYHADPVDAAKRWEAEGAQFLHVVDLDGASMGKPQNLRSLERIIDSVDVSIQFGGGIRNLSALETVLDLGVTRAVIGTGLITAPELLEDAGPKYGKRLAAGLDGRDGKLALSGWKENTEISVIEAAKQLEESNISAIIFTDIGVDGTQSGINFEAIKSLAEETNIPVIASGGVASLADITKLRVLESEGVEGVIIGRALYEGSFTLIEALAAAGEKKREIKDDGSNVL